jgi:DNA-binding protein WhiA
LAELAALIRMDAGVLRDGDVLRDVNENRERDVQTLHIDTESASVARRIFALAKSLLPLPPTVAVRRKMRLKKNNTYWIELPCRWEDLGLLGLLDEDGRIRQGGGIDSRLTAKRCDRKGYLRGAFLASGSMNNPENSYHLEMIHKEKKIAEDLAALMNGFNLKAGVSSRKHMYVTYLKDSDKISDFLALIGAHDGVLQFENIRVMKDVRNTVNRQVNCDSANLTKTVNAAMRQQEKIRLIQETAGFQIMPESLRDIALLRLEYPEATLKELGEQLSPPIGKSGVSHRLNRIEEIADKLEKQLARE